jgi:hypothetical protein
LPLHVQHVAAEPHVVAPVAPPVLPPAPPPPEGGVS